MRSVTAAHTTTHVRPSSGLAQSLAAFLFLTRITLAIATAPTISPIPFQKYGIRTPGKHQPRPLKRGDNTFEYRKVVLDDEFIEGRRLESRDDGDASDDLPDDIVHQLLENKGILYLANVTVGTPPQSMQLQIDTASSDIWVLSESIAACHGPADYDLWNTDCSFGSFNRDASSTFKLLGKDRFGILYADGTGAEGDYAEDTFTVGGATVEGMQIGVATTANLSYGILGVGFEADQASNSPGGMGIYPSLLGEMVTQGLIKSKAFSLWLDDFASDTGSILFGGIDSERFTGQLTSIPIEVAPGQEEPLAFAVPLTAVAFSNGKSHVNFTSRYLPATVILDSGSSLTFLPHPLAWSIANQTGAKLSHQLNLYIIDCNYPTDDVYVEYSFSYTLNIRVPMTELILPLTKYSGGMAKNLDGSDICALGIASSPKETVCLFGDTFLRSAYVVYDLDNARVAMAQTNFDPVGQNIVEIGIGKDSVPSVGTWAMTIMATSTIDITSDNVSD
ncbi:hypothetical protein TWF703_009286 [Orbilia oligospora]|uniref:Peptidase A1 domain-containing protein n=1 Tax=Orbilia oligospora TaxID=2813651 RepID=A0A7C8JJZ6_ORBOL|nr:hypothetical protein TWF703_009286 [Orbilia oligospora]